MGINISFHGVCSKVFSYSAEVHECKMSQKQHEIAVTSQVFEMSVY